MQGKKAIIRVYLRSRDSPNAEVYNFKHVCCYVNSSGSDLHKRKKYEKHEFDSAFHLKYLREK